MRSSAIASTTAGYGWNSRLAARRDVEEARRAVASFVAHYNDRRFHSALGFITPADKLAGLEAVIFAKRDRKPEQARAVHRQRQAPRRAEPVWPIACVKEQREKLAGVQGAGNEATWSPEPPTSIA